MEVVDAVPMLAALTAATIVVAVIWFVVRGVRRKRKMRARMKLERT
jgi:hypothetical protein